MILQLGVFLLSLLLFATWGLPVAAALRGAMPMMVLSAPAFGVGLLAVVATVLFSFGLHLSVIAIGAVAVSLISIVVFRKTIRFMLSGIRQAWFASCLVLIFSIIVLAPVLADRAALTVFQANIADHFGYMATSVVYSQIDFQQILGAICGITFQIHCLLCRSKSLCPSGRLNPVCGDRQSVARRYDGRWIRLPLQFRGGRPPFLLRISSASLPSPPGRPPPRSPSVSPVAMHAAFGANIRWISMRGAKSR